MKTLIIQNVKLGTNSIGGEGRAGQGVRGGECRREGRGEASSDHTLRSAPPKPSQMHIWWNIIIVMDTSHGCSIHRLECNSIHMIRYHSNIHKGGIQGGTSVGSNIRPGENGRMHSDQHMYCPNHHECIPGGI